MTSASSDLIIGTAPGTYETGTLEFQLQADSASPNACGGGLHIEIEILGSRYA